jgi:hypothetical protein
VIRALIVDDKPENLSLLRLFFPGRFGKAPDRNA